jgi:hypothetical protein
MAHRILIPTPLRPFAASATSSKSKANRRRRPAGARRPVRRSSPHLYNEDGRLRSFVNIYVNDEDIRHLDREKTR